MPNSNYYNLPFALTVMVVSWPAKVKYVTLMHIRKIYYYSLFEDI
jgi:hypothetical protein